MKTSAWSLEDHQLRFTITSGERGLRATLQAAGAPQIWQSERICDIWVHRKYLRRTEVLPEPAILEVTAMRDSLHVVLGDASRKISVGLWLALHDGELSVSLHPMEVYEDNDSLYRVFALDLLPGLMQVRNGTLLLPLGAGMTCATRNKPRLNDRFLVYGEQERWELLPTLPVCAALYGDRLGEQGGIMALASQGACDAQCRVATDGQGGGEAGFAVTLRRHWPDPVDFGTREIRYAPVPAGQRGDLFVARRLRRHVIQDLGKATLERRAAESPELAYLLRAYTMKICHAIHNDRGNMRLNQFPGDFGSPTCFDAMTTFAEAGAGMEALHAAGIDKIVTQSTGWSPRGHDGMYPTRLPPDLRLGGQAGFAEMIAHGQELGYAMSVHDNYNDAYRVSPNWKQDGVIHDVFGEPLVCGVWGGGTTYRRWPLTDDEADIEGEMRRVQALGVRGHYYCDAIGNPLEVNYHPVHGGPRSHCAAGIGRQLDTARRVFGSAGAECGFLYAALHADCISTCGYAGYSLLSDWPITALCDSRWPLWHLALHGLVLLEGHELSWRGAMDNLLLGLHPRTEWCARPGMFPTLEAPYLGALKTNYDLCVVQYGRLQAIELIDYQEPAPGVACSRFEDGTLVECDYNSGVLTVDGARVAAPEVLAGYAEGE